MVAGCGEDLVMAVCGEGLVIAGRPDKWMMVGRRDPDVDGGGVPMAQTQSSTEQTAHNGDEGGRSLDVEGMAAYIWGTTKIDEDPMVQTEGRWCWRPT